MHWSADGPGFRRHQDQFCRKSRIARIAKRRREQAHSAAPSVCADAAAPGKNSHTQIYCLALSQYRNLGWPLAPPETTMRRSFATAVLVCMYGISCANATPVACPTAGTYATLISLNSAGGCTIDNLLFSDFTFSSSQTNGAPAVTATDLVISNVIDSAPASVGFAFGNIPMTAGRAQIDDVTVAFTIASVAGNPVITGAALNELGRGVPDTGFATIDESLCTAGTLSPCPSGNSLGLHTSFNSTLVQRPTDSITLSGVPAIAVSDHLHAEGGIVGSGEITGFSNTFADVPEPAAFTLMGFGLLMLLLFRSRWLFGTTRS